VDEVPIWSQDLFKSYRFFEVSQGIHLSFPSASRSLSALRGTESLSRISSAVVPQERVTECFSSPCSTKIHLSRLRATSMSLLGKPVLKIHRSPKPRA